MRQWLKLACFAIAILTAALLPGTTLRAQSKQTAMISAGSQSPEWDVKQQVLLNASVFPAVPLGTLPTGNVQFFANGIPVGSATPLTFINTGVTPGLTRYSAVAQAAVTFATPGTYLITATYAGDSDFSPATSYDSENIILAVDPPEIQIVATPGSLTLPAGAAVGNTIAVTFNNANGFHGNSDSNATLTTTGATVPATITATSSLFANGNSVENFTILSTPPHLSTASAKWPPKPWGWKDTGGLRLSAALAFLILPLTRLRVARRAQWTRLLPLALLAFLSGCGSSASTSSQHLVGGSSGQYTLSVSGRAYDQATGAITWFSVSVPVTIQ